MSTEFTPEEIETFRKRRDSETSQMQQDRYYKWRGMDLSCTDHFDTWNGVAGGQGRTARETSDHGVFFGLMLALALWALIAGLVWWGLS